MRRATVLLGLGLVGCRALLGIEDAPPEDASVSGGATTATASSGTPTPSSADASGTGPGTGDGGAPSSSNAKASSVDAGGGDDKASASSGEGGGGAGLAAVQVVPLDEPGLGLRLFLDRYDDGAGVDEKDQLVVVSRDDGEQRTYFWRFADDLSSNVRCFASIAPDVVDGHVERVASSFGNIVYTGDGRSVFYTQAQDGCSGAIHCECTGQPGKLDLAGIDVKDGEFYAVSGSGELGKLLYGSNEINGGATPRGIVQGGPLSIHGNHAWALMSRGFPTAATVELDLGGENARLDLEGAFELLAITAISGGGYFVWRHITEHAILAGDGTGNTGIIVEIPYAGKPGGIAADEQYVFVPSDDGLVICTHSGADCRILRRGFGNVVDVVRTSDDLIFLQEADLVRVAHFDDSFFEELEAFSRQPH